MHTLTPEGLMLVEQAAHRHNVGTDAILTLLRALDRGGGTQAQFSHPDLGGMGQWSRGGMIMVGDMFNNGLKARVDQMCNELSDLLRNNTLFAPAPRGTSGNGGSWNGGSWWPPEFGSPSSSGSQNDMSYAYFPDTRRLALRRGGMVSLYETGDHQIGGVSQQQSGSQDLTFTSQYGTVRLHELPMISDGALSAPSHQAPVFQTPPPFQDRSFQDQSFQSRSFQEPSYQERSFPSAPQPDIQPAFKSNDGPSTESDVFGKIERLHQLQQKGILSDAEFAEKKKELLARL